MTLLWLFENSGILFDLFVLTHPYPILYLSCGIVIFNLEKCGLIYKIMVDQLAKQQ